MAYIFQNCKVVDEQDLLKKMFPAPGLCLALNTTMNVEPDALLINVIFSSEFSINIDTNFLPALNFASQ